MGRGDDQVECCMLGVEDVEATKLSKRILIP